MKVNDDGLDAVEVLVKLTAPGMRAESPPGDALRVCGARLGVTLTPLHAGTVDPELASYFVASVAPALVERVITEFRACPGVEAAYAKPRGEAP